MDARQIMVTAILGIVTVLILVAFYSPLDTGITDANVSGTGGTLLDQIPLIFIVGILLIAIGAFLYYKGR